MQTVQGARLNPADIIMNGVVNTAHAPNGSPKIPVTFRCQFVEQIRVKIKSILRQYFTEKKIQCLTLLFGRHYFKRGTPAGVSHMVAAMINTSNIFSDISGSAVILANPPGKNRPQFGILLTLCFKMRGIGLP